MSTTQAPTAADPGSAAPSASAAPTLSPWSLICRLCRQPAPAGPSAICEHCLGPLEPVPPANRVFPSRETIAARAPNLWRYREWLPFTGYASSGPPTPLSPDSG
ncbi:MAG: hypothetical protein ACRENQ_12825, partial [Gemmatimonadaceae bacterium]